MIRLGLLLILSAAPLSAQIPDTEFFEKKIRPVLATKCYMCHSSQLKSPMGGLVLDTRVGLLKGGATGPVIVPGNPADSRLLGALQYANPQLKMPPTGKLADEVVADFERWIAAGAPDPRDDMASGAAAPKSQKGLSIEEGRKWWAFQPVKEISAPKVKEAAWPRTKIDSFVLSKLEEKGLKPSPPADARTLARRAFIDLVGLRPSYEEVEDFAKDTSPNAYEKLIERLLDSPRYGERWGRHWLDVARYGEDFGEAPWAYAWRYRDWVIEAINQDIPYDRFVKMQLAADLMPGTTRQDLRALGYLGTAPIYHKDFRLSQEVLFSFATDDWEERVDALTRGLLGMTVACARCHDHKYDPISTKDYYALAGVFASTSITKRPLFDVDPAIEARFGWVEQRLFDLREIDSNLTNIPQTKPEDAAVRLANVRAEVRRFQAEMAPLNDRYPALAQYLARYWPDTPRRGEAGATQVRRRDVVSEEPFMNVVYDAALYVDGKDSFMTEMDYRPGEARNLPVFPRGNVSTPGEIVPRRFLTVLSKNPDEVFQKGSGRLELAEKIFTDGASVAARVIVNRVWGWHFGKPLVGTPSDFGTQGEKPSHPELLDDLAARFIAHGWSLKWLHREIMLSAAYRQANAAREDGLRLDQTNQLVWRMNPRRMDIEAYRDSILRASGQLSDQLYGPSVELDADGNNRRTVYARISRQNLNILLKLYDFPDAMQTSPGREPTTTPLQQLFVMNSAFMQEQAAALAKSVETETEDAAKVRSLYRKVLGRDPDRKEIEIGLNYLANASLSAYAQILLATNEEIFWP